MGYKIGICGLSGFGDCFVELFVAHPLVDEVILCDLDADRLAAAAKKHKISKTCASLDELCKTDVDGICLFTQRWLHGPQSIQILKSGKKFQSLTVKENSFSL